MTEIRVKNVYTIHMAPGLPVCIQEGWLLKDTGTIQFGDSREFSVPLSNVRVFQCEPVAAPVAVPETRPVVVSPKARSRKE